MSAKKDIFFVFDMDGVILNSLDSLSRCLLKAIQPFCQSNAQYTKFSKYDSENPGLSRFEKIDFFLNSLSLTNHTDTKKIKHQILDKFELCSLEARLKSEIDESTYDLPKKITINNLILLSNCDNTHLRVIADHFGFHQIFSGGLIGTPPSKKIRFEHLMNNYKSKNFVSISDSESDAIIARSLNVPFAFIQNFARDEAPWLRTNENRFQNISEFILESDRFKM